MHIILIVIPNIMKKSFTLNEKKLFFFMNFIKYLIVINNFNFRFRNTDKKFIFLRDLLQKKGLILIDLKNFLQNCYNTIYIYK